MTAGDNQPGKRLTVHNATVTTATVEIKTLTVSGRQVTLSLFRQLRLGQLIDEDGALAGTPWGHVNYHPDKCGEEPGHLHVVWQCGEDLVRAQIAKKPRFDPLSSKDYSMARTAAMVAELGAGNAVPVYRDIGLSAPVNPREPILGADRLRRDFMEEVEGVSVHYAIAPSVMNAAFARHELNREQLGRTAREYSRTCDAEALAAAQALVAKYDAGQAEERAMIAIRAEGERQARYRETVTSLLELPQLFIAT